jgi:hypothetical protein
MPSAGAPELIEIEPFYIGAVMVRTSFSFCFYELNTTEVVEMTVF